MRYCQMSGGRTILNLNWSAVLPDSFHTLLCFWFLITLWNFHPLHGIKLPKQVCLVVRKEVSEDVYPKSSSTRKFGISNGYSIPPPLQDNRTHFWHFCRLFFTCSELSAGSRGFHANLVAVGIQMCAYWCKWYNHSSNTCLNELKIVSHRIRSLNFSRTHVSQRHRLFPLRITILQSHHSGLTH